jgi:toxin ParE1/3/4
VTYRVVITPDAKDDLRNAYRYIRDDSPESARRWAAGARKAIRTLARNPERCALAPEDRSFAESIRQLLYGSGNRRTYRILFVILKGTVFVLHVRHGSMTEWSPV